jgi:flavin-dependent dehydrogenase
MREASARAADVVVVGGGPAGSTAAASLAAQGLRVILLEQSRYESARFGEVLSPRVVPLLESLGVMRQFLAEGQLPSPGMVSVWGGLKDERPSLLNPYGDGWHVDRARFDNMLARAATNAGVTLYTGVRFKGVVRNAAGSGLTVAFSTENCAHTLHVRFLIDATGRSAKLARRLGARQERIDRLVTVVAVGETRTGADPRMLIEAAERGWWYSATLHSGRTVFAYLTDADLVPRAHAVSHSSVFDVALRSAPHTFARACGVPMSTPRVTSAASTRLVTPVGTDWLAVGDAAAAFDPLSAHGVPRAINSGLYAAQVVAAYLSEARPDNKQALVEEYGRQCDSNWSAYLGERQRAYGSEKRWPDSVFWQRRRSLTSNAAMMEGP